MASDLPVGTPKLYNYNNVFSPIDIDDPDLNRYPLQPVTVLDVVGTRETMSCRWPGGITSLPWTLSVVLVFNLDCSNQFSYQNPEIRGW
jgi:hypothetical protein